MPRENTPRHNRTIFLVSLAAIALAGVLVGVLHVELPALTVNHTLSEYALSGKGWVFTAALLSLAAGSGAVLVAMARTRFPRHRRTLVLIGLWVVGLVVAAVFHTDPGPQHRTMVGMVHNVASLLAFLGLPLAGLLFAGHLRRHHPSGPWPGRLRRLTVLSLVITALFLVQFVGEDIPVLGRVLAQLPEHNTVGLTERLAVLAEVALLITFARWSASAAAVRRLSRPAP